MEPRTWRTNADEFSAQDNGWAVASLVACTVTPEHDGRPE